MVKAVRGCLGEQPAREKPHELAHHAIAEQEKSPIGEPIAQPWHRELLNGDHVVAAAGS